jgi:RNA polymerase sigma factor (sigma-70 family)
MTWRIEVDPSLVSAAARGDREARDQLAFQLCRPIYNLAVRFFFEPADAEDAAQEATLRVLTMLPRFAGKSAFSTWCYRVAVNSLLASKRRPIERLTLKEGDASLAEGLAAWGAGARYHGPDADLLAEEVKLSCTTALLVCLSRPLRMAYILGEIVGLAAAEAAEVLEITPEAFRKRLSLARVQVRRFLAPRCGLLDRNNACRCDKQVPWNLEVGWIDPRALRFARSEEMRRLEVAFDEAVLYASHPEYEESPELKDRLRSLLADIETAKPSP